ncbi:MAG: hypothetical protein Q7T16_01590 [Candidatus Burarchaeum sp.]|nr:hypothetical protein [Candidatus Burarchaeum sp.]MDO8339329.1 hypothetical protein [Candidatus Burarchaeum sp.]
MQQVKKAIVTLPTRHITDMSRVWALGGRTGPQLYSQAYSNNHITSTLSENGLLILEHGYKFLKTLQYDKVKERSRMVKEVRGTAANELREAGHEGEFRKADAIINWAIEAGFVEKVVIDKRARCTLTPAGGKFVEGMNAMERLLETLSGNSISIYALLDLLGQRVGIENAYLGVLMLDMAGKLKKFEVTNRSLAQL